MHPGLDEALIHRIRTHHIRSGPLFGAIAQQDLLPNEQRELVRVGWTMRNYIDKPVVEPPQSRVDWDDVRRRHRANVMDRIEHRHSDDLPANPTRMEILEAVLDSEWEEQEDKLRVLLHAWAYASVWGGQSDPNASRVEGSELFFFYTQKMCSAADAAIAYAVAAPVESGDFWQLVDAIAPSDNAP